MQKDDVTKVVVNDANTKALPGTVILPTLTSTGGFVLYYLALFSHYLNLTGKVTSVVTEMITWVKSQRADKVNVEIPMGMIEKPDTQKSSIKVSTAL